jgi:hypothetical protein
MKNLQALLAVLLMACAGAALAQNDPSEHQIYEAARSGHLAEAQQMVDQVLRDHPRSAEAHYVAAEVYAREGDVSRARQELSTAEQIAPGLPFLKNARALPELQAQLAAESQSARPVFTVPYSRPHASIPWGFILIVVAGIAVLWRVVRRRAAASAYQQYSGGAVATGPGYGPGPGPGYGPGYGPSYGGAPGVGSGIAGGLASGLAVGAGVVAGEELAHHFLDSDRPVGGVAPPVAPEQVDPNADMGGNDFGVSDSSGSWDDNGGGSDSFGVDSGGGGDDWT